MRQKNRLYTINKWNSHMFMPTENLFPLGGVQTSGLGNTNFASIGSSKIGTGLDFKASKALGAAMENARKGSKGNSGGSNAIGDIGGSIAGVATNALDNIQTGDPRGMWDTMDPVYHLAGGRESGAGNAMSDTGVTLTKAGLSSGNYYLALAGAGMKILGGLTNAAFGIKTDEERLRGVNQGIETNRNFVSNADSFDAIKGPTAALTNTNVYKGGWFSGGKARRKNEELKERMITARDWANRSVGNNIYNLVDDQQNDLLANYAAYGGPLDFGTGALGLMQQNRYFDTIDKRSEAIASKGQTMQTGFTGGAKSFADGGLKTAFMDEFGKDPIGAAVRYNKGLEALAAQEEAEKIEAAREAEYADMQKKLLSLETENQGLQALMAAAPIALPEIPTYSSSPSRATSGGSTWDYIEDQLRRSGRFNDNQIKGIKYNLQRESSIDPTVVGDGGSAFGLGQWHGSRKPKDMSLEGQTQHLIETISNFDGKEHWISRKDYEGFLNARTPEEAHYYLAKGYERPRADIVAKVKRDSDMSLERLKAFGGELGTNITDWTNGLLYIDEGGSHESNPLDGVPMGLDPQGIPNLVEEGETVYNDYVFSDRMRVPFFMYKELGLGGVMKKKGKEMSFADASKKLAQESEQRPNDPISQAGLEASLARLAEIQETERMRKQAKEYRGLEEYACGGKLGHKYENGTENLFGKNDFMIDFSKYPYSTPSSLFDLDTWMKIGDIQKARSSYSGDKPKEQPRVSDNSSRRDYGDKGTNGPTVKRELPPLEIPKPGSISILPDPTKISKEDLEGLKEKVEKAQRDYGSRGGYTPTEYATWMRYAPAVGSGLMTLTDALGLTNKADYTYADKIAAAAEAAGYAPNVVADPIGNYLRYNPMDIWYQQNALNAQARATDRALTNTSSPSRAAGLLANSYNSQLASGNLYRQALEYNDAKRKDVEEFNRKTNMFNSQMGLEAAMANARYQQVAKQMGLSGLAQAAALREQIDARTGTARSANLTNFLTSLGNIGRENFAMNQINFDPSRHYYGDLRGRSGYKKKCGGKMNHK